LVSRLFGKDDFVVRPFPGKREFCSAVETLAERGMRFLHLFTGDVAEYYSYEGQLRDLLGAGRARAACEERWFPDTDHLFFLDEDRSALLAITEQWLERHFSKPGVATPEVQAQRTA
jgi:hypothetical protein